MSVLEKYKGLDASKTKIHMPLEDAVALSEALADAMQADRPELIIGLANGGLLPARVVADRMELPYEMVRIRREGGRLKDRLLGVLKAIPFADGLIRMKALRGLMLKVEMAIFGRKYRRHETPAGAFDFEVAGRKLAIVDDCIVTGGSVKVVQQRLLDAGAAAVSVNVLCWNDEAAEGRPATIEPAAWLHRFVHFYPWSGNSPYNSAYLRWLAQHGLEEMP